MKHDKNEQKKIARERIDNLFDLASDNFSKNPSLSNRYAKLAKNISTRYKLRIPKNLKRKICKSCSHYLQSGVNATIRYNKGRIIITCKDCAHISRIPTKSVSQ